MNSGEINKSAELEPRLLPLLSVTEDVWLDDFGIDAKQRSDSKFIAEYNNLIEIGSYRLNTTGRDVKTLEVVAAREKFFEVIGVRGEVLEKFKKNRPTFTVLDRFVSTMQVINSFGLNGNSLINSHPNAIAYGPQPIKEKIDNYIALGLDHHEIINANPAAIGYSVELVRNKVQLIRRCATALRWSGSVKDLIESKPSILGIDSKKLQTLSHIAAIGASAGSYNVDINTLVPMLDLPLELYLIAMDKDMSENSQIQQLPIEELSKLVKQHRQTVDERKSKAEEIAQSGRLGRIGTMYLNYAGVKSPASQA